MCVCVFSLFLCVFHRFVYCFCMFLCVSLGLCLLFVCFLFVFACFPLVFRIGVGVSLVRSAGRRVVTKFLFKVLSKRGLLQRRLQCQY